MRDGGPLAWEQVRLLPAAGGGTSIETAFYGSKSLLILRGVRLVFNIKINDGVWLV
jgi:hypothetical protein